MVLPMYKLTDKKLIESYIDFYLIFTSGEYTPQQHQRFLQLQDEVYRRDNRDELRKTINKKLKPIIWEQLASAS